MKLGSLNTQVTLVCKSDLRPGAPQASASLFAEPNRGLKNVFISQELRTRLPVTRHVQLIISKHKLEVRLPVKSAVQSTAPAY